MPHVALTEIARSARRHGHRRAARALARHRHRARLPGGRDRARAERRPPRLLADRGARKSSSIAEFGIVLLLFLIGLELRPRRLWAMRSAIFSLGGAQVAITAFILAVPAVALRARLADGAVRRPRAGAVVDGVRAAGHGGDRRASRAPRAPRLRGAAVPGSRRHSAHRADAAVRRRRRRRRGRRWISWPH